MPRLVVRRAEVRAVVWLVVVLALAALGARATAQRLVPTADPKHPRLRFSDSLTSVNDRCIVSQSALNPRVKPVYVNGQPIGFC